MRRATSWRLCATTSNCPSGVSRKKKQQAKRPTPPFLEAPPPLTEEERTARMEMMRELRQTIAACRS